MDVVPRMTAQEIDTEIVDAAAHLFARHGFRQTSVQAVADEVGYSKAGLLHRFGTKESLWEAVIADVLVQADAVVALATELPAGRERDLAAIEALLDLTRRRTGFIPFVFSLLTSSPLAALDDPASGQSEDAAALHEVASRALAAFGVGLETVGRREIRVVGALGSLAVTSLALDRHPGARQHAVDAAMGALGHPTPD